MKLLDRLFQGLRGTRPAPALPPPLDPDPDAVPYSAPADPDHIGNAAGAFAVHPSHDPADHDPEEIPIPSDGWSVPPYEESAVSRAWPVEPAPPAPAPRPLEPAAAPAAPEADDDLDRATDALFAQPPRSAPARDPRRMARTSSEGAPRFGTTEHAGEDYDRAALRELFAGIASNHARPVKNLMFELQRGTAQKDWIELCRPVMTALIDGARQTGLSDAEARMSDFDAALALAGSGPEPDIDPAARELVLGCWRDLAGALPEAFHVDEDARRRETIIIHSLLKQVPGVGHVTFVRLFGAGLTDLPALFIAVPAELATTTGIPMSLCERICERMQEHRARSERNRGAMSAGERRAQLRGLVLELRRRHRSYEEACAGEWSDPATEEAKRRQRIERQTCALQIEVLLADLGDIEFAERIQAMPFGARLEALEEYVSAPLR